jgi:hypothetical protein
VVYLLETIAEWLFFVPVIFAGTRQTSISIVGMFAIRLGALALQRIASDLASARRTGSEIFWTSVLCRSLAAPATVGVVVALEMSLHLPILEFVPGILITVVLVLGIVAGFLDSHPGAARSAARLFRRYCSSSNET